MKAIPVGRNDVGTLFYVVDGASDGVIVKPDRKQINVDFVSYIHRKKVTKITDSAFHRFLWSGMDSPSDRWRNIFEYRVQPVPEEMLVGVEFLDKFPSSGGKKRAFTEAEQRASDFKLLMEGYNEKAIGRLARRSTRKLSGSIGGRQGWVRNARFDPDAWDADNDGLVQDGTPFERPALPNPPSVGHLRRGSAGRALRSEKNRTATVSPVDTILQNALAKRYALRSQREKHRVHGRTRMDLINLMKEHDKYIEQKYNDGKPILTMDDARRAFAKAHPGFRPNAKGKREGSFDLLKTRVAEARAAGVDESSLPIHEYDREIMYGLLWSIDKSPVLQDIILDIEQLESGSPADGMTRWQGNTSLGLTANGDLDFKERSGKKKVTVFYSTAFSPDLLQAFIPMAGGRRPRKELSFARPQNIATDDGENIMIIWNGEMSRNEMMVSHASAFFSVTEDIPIGGLYWVLENPLTLNAKWELYEGDPKKHKRDRAQNVKAKQQDRADYEAGIKMALRAVQFHEVTHASHSASAVNDYLTSKGLSINTPLSIDLIKEAIDDTFNRLSDSRVREAVSYKVLRDLAVRFAYNMSDFAYTDRSTPPVVGTRFSEFPLRVKNALAGLRLNDPSARGNVILSPDLDLMVNLISFGGTAPQQTRNLSVDDWFNLLDLFKEDSWLNQVTKAHDVSMTDPENPVTMGRSWYGSSLTAADASGVGYPDASYENKYLREVLDERVFPGYRAGHLTPDLDYMNKYGLTFPDVRTEGEYVRVSAKDTQVLIKAMAMTSQVVDVYNDYVIQLKARDAAIASNTPPPQVDSEAQLLEKLRLATTKDFKGLPPSEWQKQKDLNNVDGYSAFDAITGKFDITKAKEMMKARALADVDKEVKVIEHLITRQPPNLKLWQLSFIQDWEEWLASSKLYDNLTDDEISLLRKIAVEKSLGGLNYANTFVDHNYGLRVAFDNVEIWPELMTWLELGAETILLDSATGQDRRLTSEEKALIEKIRNWLWRDSTTEVKHLPH